MYDLKLLLQQANPQHVATMIGLRTKKKGRNVYCECPSHRKILGREDANISNCVLTPHGYCCFACGAKGNVFQMVIDYCDVPFPEAIKIVAELTGGYFEMQMDSSVKRQPFNAEDLAVIGITSIANPEGDAGKEILGVSESRPTSKAFFRKGHEYIIYSSAKRITLNQLFAEDENLYYTLIEKNAEIALKKYEDLYNAFISRGSDVFAEALGLLETDWRIDSTLASEVNNVFAANINRTRKILEIAKRKGLNPSA